jgi:hypothetical protein
MISPLHSLSAVCVCLAVALALTGPSNADDRLTAQAGPNVWGPKLNIRSHLGKATYTVSYKAVGNTLVVGEITYWQTKDRQVTKEFNGSITFTTADVSGTPTVRFKGIPLGSVVNVSVGP